MKTYADIAIFYSRGQSGQRLDFNWLRVEITKQNLLTPIGSTISMQRDKTLENTVKERGRQTAKHSMLRHLHTNIVGAIGLLLGG